MDEITEIGPLTLRIGTSGRIMVPKRVWDYYDLKPGLIVMCIGSEIHEASCVVKLGLDRRITVPKMILKELELGPQLLQS